MSWIEPIYDRTQADVDLIRLEPTNENNKGAYNYTDLNRIENNCEVVMNLLNNSGFFYYPITIQTKTDWVVSDIPTIGEINRIRNNIITLKNGMYVGEEYENIEFSNTMDYIKANILEKDLKLIKDIIDSCMRELRKCHTFYCGANGIGLYALPDGTEPTGFVKIKQYTGMIYCGEEINL